MPLCDARQDSVSQSELTIATAFHFFPTLAPHTFSLTFSTEEAIFGTRKRGERRQRPSEAVSQAIFRTLLLLALDVFILSFPFPFSTPHSLSVIVGNGHTHTGLASKQENESEARKSTRFGCFELFLLMPCTTLVGKNKNRERRMRILCSLELSLSLPHRHRFLIIRWLITSSSPVCLTDYLF